MEEKIKEILKDINGLTEEEVLLSKSKNGSNEIENTKNKSLILEVIEIFKEPMFLLLIIAASVYFIVGEYSDGVIMLICVVVICLIEFLQKLKTDKALEELKKLSALNVRVIRNGTESIIDSGKIVVGDIIILLEGDRVPADGKLLYAESLGVNESLLTGEAEVVYKSIDEDNKNRYKLNMCYSGTDITSGAGIIEVSAVGRQTELGLIGESLKEIENNRTPLEMQVSKLVIICTIMCAIVFVLMIIINYLTNMDLPFKERIVTSLLSGITIAMSTIPEEIPVVLTVFLSLGAFELAKENTLTRNIRAIETLGAINVLCTDKTGTLTENKMTVQDIYSYSKSFRESAYYACGNMVYDPMEIAIKKYFKKGIEIKTNYKITKEYAFDFKTKMTGEVWNNKVLYVKGAYESVLPLCNLSKEEIKELEEKILTFSSDGYRVIAVGKNNKMTEMPEELGDVRLEFEGLIALFDPLRSGVKNSLEECTNAGIRVIMITGDNGETAKGIAKKINFPNANEVITGIELENMTDKELLEKVKEVNIFARVYPNHKMRIVNALQKDNKIVAMTGDGVNDAPALKKADIGIAMGKRGTNVAKESADIILLDDNFNTIVKAIKNGRTIYSNIKKAISYIVVIHVPIALLSLSILLLNLPVFLMPIHVLLLELLIDPTSSIAFQRIKPKSMVMRENPRDIKEPILNKKNAIRCILQGFWIFIVVLLSYMYLLNNNYSLNYAITVSYSILVLAIMLIAYQLKSSKSTLYNFKESLSDKVTLAINIMIILGLILFIYVPVFNKIVNTVSIKLESWIFIIVLALIAVIPFDILKLRKRN